MNEYAQKTFTSFGDIIINTSKMYQLC